MDKITVIQKYGGLSTDTKPTVGVPIGSVFEEYDTSHVFKYTGSSWTEYIIASESRNYIFNTSAMSWNAATGSLAGESNVTVVNFPASYPVTNAYIDSSLSGIKTTLDNIKAKTDNLDVLLSTRLKAADTLTKVSTVDTITNPVPIDQHVVVDNLNSLTVAPGGSNLAVGASWEGSGTNTLGVVGIQVSLKTDQNMTVYVYQSPDGTNWDIVDSYNYYASINNFGVTVQAVNSYVKVKITNTGGATTTYIRLQTVLCPIVEALPRSLDENGHLSTSIHGMVDGYGFGVENTPIGEMRVVSPTRLIGANFDGRTIDPNFWTVTNSNDGTTAQANAQITLATNITTANGSTSVYSVRRARYSSGSSMNFRGIITLSAGAVDNKRRWGIAFGATMPTITDGAYFELDGTTFSIVTNKGSSETRVSSGSFNGNLGAIYSPGTSVKTYEIYWTNSKVWFVIGDDILHTVSASSATWSNTMHHYIYLDNVNSNSLQTNNTLECRSVSVRRLGTLLTQPTSKYFSGQTAGTVCKYGPGNIHGVAISGVANNSVITLYDGLTSAGEIRWTSGSMGPSTAPFFVSLWGIPFFIGLTLVVATANSTVTVAYE